MSIVEKEEDYSDYIKHLSNMGSMYAFLSGFMFTAITLVLTRLSDPTTLMAQVVLFFMAVMLNVFIFYMGFFSITWLLCARIDPSILEARALSTFLAMSA